MSRSAYERVADVRRLLAGAGRIYERRSSLIGELAATTGLSPEGVRLGFESLERDAPDADLHTLVRRAGTAHHVHVVVSANVFVAPLRALALARAAGERVTVRPSPRDPTLTRALVAEAGDPAITLVSDRDVEAVGADVVHAYGRDETMDAIRGRARAARTHGAGFAAAVVGAAANLSVVAEALARDVVAFDQRGCLSPPIAVVRGDAARARLFAEMLHASLAEWERAVPRGALHDTERAASVHWTQAHAFAGTMLVGPAHAVALANDARLVPPAGRHVTVIARATEDAIVHVLAPLADALVAVGGDDANLVDAVAPGGARRLAIGRMQTPPLDGPVDLRATLPRERPCSG